MLCEAAAVTDDERVGDAVATLSRALREAWPCRGPMLDAMHGIDACLAAAMFLSGGRPDGRDLIAGAVDELERVVSLAYRPGESLPRSLRSPDEPDGGVEEHVAAAAALLTAHGLTARLPYSMLAEELIQPVRRTHGRTRRRRALRAGARSRPSGAPARRRRVCARRGRRAVVRLPRGSENRCSTASRRWRARHERGRGAARRRAGRDRARLVINSRSHAS